MTADGQLLPVMTGRFGALSLCQMAIGQTFASVLRRRSSSHAHFRSRPARSWVACILPGAHGDCPRRAELLEQTHDALVKRFTEGVEALQTHAFGLRFEVADLVHRRRQGRIVLDQSLLGRNAV